MIVKMPVGAVKRRTQEVLTHINEVRKFRDEKHIAEIKEEYLCRKLLWVIPRKPKHLTTDEAIEVAISREGMFGGWSSSYGWHMKERCIHLMKACEIAEDTKVETIGVENKDIEIFKWYDD